MANVKYWRKMTWALVLWSAGIVVFMFVGGPGISSGAIGVVSARRTGRPTANSRVIAAGAGRNTKDPVISE